MEDAIEKINTEMDANPNNAYVQVVGQMLLHYLRKNPGAAEQIMAEGKTIKGSLALMKDEARKHQIDGCGVLTDQEGFAVVLSYFDIQAASATAMPPAADPDTDFDVKLDELL